MKENRRSTALRRYSVTGRSDGKPCEPYRDAEGWWVPYEDAERHQRSCASCLDYIKQLRALYDELEAKLAKGEAD